MSTPRTIAALLLTPSFALGQTQIGQDDFRVSVSGLDGSHAIDATRPAVAHSAIANEYLVVWQADSDVAPAADEHFEIWGRFYSDQSGEPLGEAMRLSDAGPLDDPGTGAQRPRVVFNSVRNEFLVVWEAVDDRTP